jgi:hypothetical protein
MLRYEIVRTSDEWIGGTVETSNDKGDRDASHGTAEAFQLSGNWRVATGVPARRSGSRTRMASTIVATSDAAARAIFTQSAAEGSTRH